jgi:hypothetical protein
MFARAGARRTVRENTTLRMRKRLLLLSFCALGFALSAHCIFAYWGVESKSWFKSWLVGIGGAGGYPFAFPDVGRIAGWNALSPSRPQKQACT